MEHRVKQRSQEWFKLRRTVMLTASQFADAVGVGKGKPFHFFQSVVESKGQNNESSGNGGKTEAQLHGEQMESVIKEAYELLTGFHVLESGFWVPEEGHSMEGLIGASPDGVVIKEKDASRMLGLVEFKAPAHKLYDKIPGTRHGIPRYYMVQMQGQMAVCGAPWCDFIAVCSKTEEIMLRRVYFQPRFWEHIACRLKQFCFAMQEAEIMGDLKRDLYSGAMTQRIKTLSMQDKQFPGEDLITVENLLTRSPQQLYRGPSGRLLSYQVLVGDTFILPSTLSRYKNDLLTKVDAEIQLKAPGLGGDILAMEDEEIGQVFHRVFCEDGITQVPSSSESVVREGSAIWGKENVNRWENRVTQSATSSNSSLSLSEGSARSGANRLGSKNTLQDRHEASKNSTGPPSGNSGQSGQNAHVAGKNSAGPGPGTKSPLSSPALGQSFTPTAEPAPLRKLSRIKGSPRQLGRPRPGAGNSSPRAAAVGRAQSLVGSGGVPRIPLRGRGPRAAVSQNTANTSTPQKGPRMSVSRNMSPKISAASEASPRVVSGAHKNVSRSPASLSSVVPRSSVSPVAMGTAASVLSGLPSGDSSSASRTAETTVSDGAMSTAGSTASTALSSVQINLFPSRKKPAISARDEWEITSKKKTAVSNQNAASDPDTAVHKSTVPTPLDNSQSKPVKSVTQDVSPASGVISGGKLSSQSEDMRCKTDMMSSESSFVPPSMTHRLAFDTSSVSQTALDMTAKDSSKSATQHNTKASTQQKSGATTLGHQREGQDRRNTDYQAHKRAATSASEVEAKKALIDKVPNMLLSAEERERHRSPERIPIHRPWQIHEQGWDYMTGSERHPPFVRDRMEMGRDRDHKEMGRDMGHMEMDRDRNRMEMGRDRPLDLGYQRVQPPDDLGERIQSLLDRSRDDTPSRVYDHHDRLVAEDLHQNRNRGPHGLRANPVSTAAQFDNLRHVPLDLSERRHLQERELFSASRAPLLGREGNMGQDRGAIDGGAWRGQFARQLPLQLRQQVSGWVGLQGRSDMQGLRNPAHSSWGRGQAVRMEGLHALDLQAQLRDRRFPNLDGRDPRDPRLGGANLDIQGDVIRGQFHRNFPRRPPFDY